MDKFGWQLLNEAVRWGLLKMVQFFLDNQPLYADIYDRDGMGNTALLAVADIYNYKYPYCYGYYEFCLERNEVMMNLLLDRGTCASDIVLPTWGQEGVPNTVLILAAQWISPNIIKRLIDCGANVYTKVTYDRYDLGYYTRPDWISNIIAFFAVCLFNNYKAVKIPINC
jgi:hypothetical protein